MGLLRNIRMMLQLSLRSLFRRKVRTLLTSFSVFIGVFIILFLLSLSNGAQKIIIEQITRQFDLKTIIVLKQGSLNNNFFSTVAEENIASTKIITKDDLIKISNLENVDFVQPIVNISGRKFKFKNEEFDARVVNNASGGGWDLMEQDEIVSELLAGKYLNLSSSEIVLTKDLVDAYGKGYDEVLGQVVILEDQPSLFGSQTKPIPPKEYTVVGVVNKIRNFVYIVSEQEGLETVSLKNNYDSVEEYLNTAGYQSLYVKATSEEFVKGIASEIKEMGFEASTLEDVLSVFNILFQIVPLIFSVIGGVAVIVASIGIVNTMIMSVYERTREIGVLKAVGARNVNVLNIFMFESGLIGLFGGVSAVILAVLIMRLFNWIFAEIVAPEIGLKGGSSLFIYDSNLLVGSLMISILVGIVAGLYPAYRASKLDPVEALRYE